MPATTPTPAHESARCLVRERIGSDAKSGHYPVPHRYRLHLSLSCADGLRVAITHALLGLADTLPVTLLPAPPDEGPERAALRAAYQATVHGYQGPASSPALTDSWTGRLVSNHVPDLLVDLSLRFRAAGRPELRPAGLAAEIDALTVRCERDIAEAAQLAGEADAGAAGERALDVLLATLAEFDRRVAGSSFVLGETLTAADVELWVALVRLDTAHRCHLGADAVHRIAGHPALWAYARRLCALPAFGGQLRLAELARAHEHCCRGLEAAGAAVQIVDWTAAPHVLTR
ncbi:glutathione S-transferase C-terminal domain-containing protein [Streptomyces sp. DSM 44915]|uniref:Glutathione S-transferase C-terminal domain-containing protein n=1 Tax=Streptomyces chisholmiae TaxID=3075540 RepID=A0ABU2JNX3_9ACTN|nr:glutathione S-transferase C-terminal domain-containing protein [Streptomyces sp. DSM 44915]MDT0266428.1 glutathione S-transferase C-terminal domain-containing protein [Streptomyces sp. DSM 44915]